MTGNVKEIAKAKLSSVGVYQYFTTGGFGGTDPHTTRADLVNFALKKSGYENRKNLVCLVGDTPLDIKAAHGAGIEHVVCVATGIYSLDELKQAGAESVLDDFKNTEITLKAFGF